MTRIEFWSAVMGLLVAIVVMFNQMNGRLDTLNARIDTLQVENQRQHDALQEQINRRFDTMQAEKPAPARRHRGGAAHLRGTHHAP